MRTLRLRLLGLSTGSVGDALMPYSERMDKAMKEIRVSCATPAPQRK
jgi:hypothetical protein